MGGSGLFQNFRTWITGAATTHPLPNVYNKSISCTIISGFAGRSDIDRCSWCSGWTWNARQDQGIQILSGNGGSGPGELLRAVSKSIAACDFSSVVWWTVMWLWMMTKLVFIAYYLHQTVTSIALHCLYYVWQYNSILISKARSKLRLSSIFTFLSFFFL